MTVPPVAVDALNQAQPLTVDDAYARSHRAALAPSRVGPVGLEIETHLVDLDAVPDRVAWDRIDPMPGVVRAAAGRCQVTLEPGGQLELSGPPAPDILAAVTGLRHDVQGTRLAWAGSASAWLTRAPTRSGRRGGSTRARGTAPWNSTTPPPAGVRPPR